MSDRIAALRELEDGPYRCPVDYISSARAACKDTAEAQTKLTRRAPRGKGRFSQRRKARSRPAVPLKAQIAAMQECARFLDLLSFDASLPRSGSPIPSVYGRSPASAASPLTSRGKDESKVERRTDEITLSNRFSLLKTVESQPDLGASLSDEASACSSGRSITRIRGVRSDPIPASVSPFGVAEEEKPTPADLASWRGQMCAWAVQTVDSLGLDREIVSVAFSHVDRYLSLLAEDDAFVGADEFQLLCVSALRLAAKSIEPSCRFTAEDLSQMSGGTFTREDFDATEYQILMALGWRLNPPTPLTFARAMLDDHWPIDGTEEDLMRREDVYAHCQALTGLAVADASLVGKRASSIATAVILVAADRASENGGKNMGGFSVDQFCESLENHTDIIVRGADVSTCVRRLEGAYWRC